MVDTERDDIFGFTGNAAKILLTLECNNECVFCYNRREKGRFQTLELDTVRRLVDAAIDEGCRHLNFIGGEVTTLPYFLELVQHAGGRFSEVSINSNGRMFHDMAFARAAVEGGLKYVDASVHGASPRTHDALTQSPGAFDESIAGLRNLVTLREEGLEVLISITTIVLDSNVADLEALGELLYDIGVYAWRLKFPHGALGCEADVASNDYLVKYSEVVPIITGIIDSLAGRMNIMTHDIPLCLLGEYMDYSSDVHEPHSVALYTKDDPEAELVRVTGHWGNQSKRCLECAALGACCMISPAYKRKHGDDELVPFDIPTYEATGARSREARRARDAAARAAAEGESGADARWSAVAHETEPDRRTAAFSTIEGYIRANDWKTVRGLAKAFERDFGEDPEAARLVRLAEAHLIDDEIGRLVAAGDRAKAARLRARLARDYADVI